MGSLSAWNSVADSPAWRGQPSAPRYLRQQALLWRDLLLTDATPADLVHPGSALDHVGSLVPVLRQLSLQIVGSAVGVLLLGAGAYLLSNSSSSSGWTGAFLGTIGIFGVTASSVSARAKTSANDLLAKLRNDVDADLLTAAATRRPTAPRGVKEDGPKKASPGSWAAPVSIDDAASELRRCREQRAAAAESTPEGQPATSASISELVTGSATAGSAAAAPTRRPSTRAG
jgi:hypothetical protein